MRRVVVIDPFEVVRTGVRALLRESGQHSVVGEGSDGKEAMRHIERLKPDAMILETVLDTLPAAEVVRQSLNIHPPVRIVGFSGNTGRSQVQQMLKAGVHGYVFKSCPQLELLKALEAVLRGDYYFSPQAAAIVSSVVRGGARSTDTPLELLSSREREVFQYLAEGKTNKEIARILRLNIRTIETHRSTVMRKLKVSSIAGITKLAIVHGVISLER